MDKPKSEESVMTAAVMSLSCWNNFRPEPDRKQEEGKRKKPKKCYSKTCVLNKDPKTAETIQSTGCLIFKKLKTRNGIVYLEGLKL